MRTPALCLALALSVGACADAPATAEEPVRPGRRVAMEAEGGGGALAPDLRLSGPEGGFHLAEARGKAVVFLFAPSESAAWAGLREAAPDLEAGGALVVGVAPGEASSPAAPGLRPYTDPEGVAAAGAGYGGEALALVVGPDGRVRGRMEGPKGAADFYALAAPALLEMESDAPPVAATDGPAEADPERVRELVRSGAALFDLRPIEQALREGAIPHAARVTGPLVPSALPANLAVPVVFIGPDAEASAMRAQAWGYDAVFFFENAAELARPSETVAEPAAAPQRNAPRPQPRPARG